ncbi:hypothetical protein EV421DRAFT_1733185 [Armillaria borealis]|uniref:Uncharacterized protein n=1 Tax=Armillaria borealis TaxID=47425 RepID=A0AA39MVW9_9AGAR|nr:hypothetical protein EV421DRAFT_1733185 [Armillaria borealis]
MRSLNDTTRVLENSIATIGECRRDWALGRLGNRLGSTFNDKRPWPLIGKKFSKQDTTSAYNEWILLQEPEFFDQPPINFDKRQSPPWYGHIGHGVTIHKVQEVVLVCSLIEGQLSAKEYFRKAEFINLYFDKERRHATPLPRQTYWTGALRTILHIHGIVFKDIDIRLDASYSQGHGCFNFHQKVREHFNHRSDTRRSSTNLASESARSSNRIAMRLRGTVMWISTYGPAKLHVNEYIQYPTYESFRRSFQCAKEFSMYLSIGAGGRKPQWLLRRRNQSRPAPPRVIAYNIIKATKSNRRRRIERAYIGGADLTSIGVPLISGLTYGKVRTGDCPTSAPSVISQCMTFRSKAVTTNANRLQMDPE